MKTRNDPRIPSSQRVHVTPRRAPLRGLLLGAALTVIMAAGWPPLPMVGFDLGADPAFAKNGNSNGDRGNRGNGNRNGHDRRDAQGVLRLFDDDGSRIWNGNGNGHRNGHDNGRHLGHERSGANAARTAPRLSDDETATILTSLTPPSLRVEPHFSNHGQRVRTYVAIARALGFNGSVGAMQANFGTPFENGLVATDPVTGEFVKDPVTGEFIIDATDAEIAAVKPGNGPKSGWEIETSLDVNMDGVVDQHDLDVVLAGFSPPDDDTNGVVVVDVDDDDNEAVTLLLP